MAFPGTENPSLWMYDSVRQNSWIILRRKWSGVIVNGVLVTTQRGLVAQWCGSLGVGARQA